MMNIHSNLSFIRQEMLKNNIQAYIIPSSDPHQSEYVAEHWQARKWASGFTGSAGTLVVFHDEAGLWTDSRYFLQAAQELKGTGIRLHKMFNQFEPLYLNYVIESLKPGQNVAVDGLMWSHAACLQIQQKCSEHGLGFSKNLDVISPVWQNRPLLSKEKIFIHDIKYTGKSTSVKLDEIRLQMKSRNLDYHFISALDDIAWTFNIRGNDVDFNPVAVAYAITGLNDAFLFIDEDKLDDTVRMYFSKEGVTVLPYTRLGTHLQNMNPSASILIDPSICSAAVHDQLVCRVVHGASIPKLLKAIKTQVEINHIEQAMIKDSAALANTFYWFENNLGKETITEYSILEKLAYFRSHQEAYFGESFGAIVGYKENGAIIHYAPPTNGSAVIHPEGILLVDSGGQYQDGTTDITRTFSLDAPDAEARKHYTLILKGLIALSKIKFPKGTTGGQLDTLARQFLWENGLNYLHGTGHGVGFFLNVHEPPQGFAAVSSERSRTVIEAGMLTSNEPGHYIPGKYGMRLENLIVCRESDTEGFLCFDTVTLYPFEIQLIDQKLLTPAEIKWLNQYHDDVKRKVSPLLKGDIVSWFENKCATLPWNG